MKGIAYLGDQHAGAAIMVAVNPKTGKVIETKDVCLWGSSYRAPEAHNKAANIIFSVGKRAPRGWRRMPQDDDIATRMVNEKIEYKKWQKESR